MVSNAWGYNCGHCDAGEHGFLNEAHALRAEIIHYEEGNCADPGAQALAGRDRERLAQLGLTVSVTSGRLTILHEVPRA